jgi:hypothetical protein
MAEKEERPYFNYSILQLEELFERLKEDPDFLKALDFELSLRTTNRAAKLRSRVREVPQTLSIKLGNAVGADGYTSSTDHSISAVPFSEKPGWRTNLTREQSKALKSTTVPPSSPKPFIRTAYESLIGNSFDVMSDCSELAFE